MLMTPTLISSLKSINFQQQQQQQHRTAAVCMDSLIEHLSFIENIFGTVSIYCSSWLIPLPHLPSLARSFDKYAINCYYGKIHWKWTTEIDVCLCRLVGRSKRFFVFHSHYHYYYRSICIPHYTLYFQIDLNCLYRIIQCSFSIEYHLSNKFRNFEHFDSASGRNIVHWIFLRIN